MKILAMLLLVFGVQANEQFSKQVQNPTLDVSGQFTQKRLTQSERLKLMRRRVEKQTERMISKKIETLRLKRELEMNKRIMKAMNDSMNQLDNNLNQVQ